jgi:hypothetical protein
MDGRTIISTPLPSARAVGQKLGVDKRRVAKLIRLMDSIHRGDSVSPVPLGKKRSGATKRVNVKVR